MQQFMARLTASTGSGSITTLHIGDKLSQDRCDININAGFIRPFD